MLGNILHSTRFVHSVRKPLPKDEVEVGLECRCQLPAHGQLPAAAFMHISKLLRHLDGRDEYKGWYLRPRIYTVLRHIGGLHLMNDFIEARFTDFALPFDQSTIPGFLAQAGLDRNFLAYQNAVLTDARDVEALAGHGHFRDEASVFYESIGDLGRGGHGAVDHVWSKLSLGEYARKKILRANSEANRRLQRAVIDELQLLKGLKHRHLVKIVGSYTDPIYIAYLMLPIAECNLRQYLLAVENEPNSRSCDVSIRLFYGCLTGALEYLHSKSIRHRDLKPDNILIKDRRVFIADFGSALDGALTGRTTTQDRNPPVTTFFLARVQVTARNSAADMWSLGLVFLEIATTLAGKKSHKYQSFLVSHAKERRQQPYPYANHDALIEWMAKLRKKGDNTNAHRNNEPLNWTTRLLQHDPRERISAKALLRDIHESPFRNDYCCAECEFDFRAMLYGGDPDTEQCRYETDYRTEVAAFLPGDEADLPISQSQNDKIVSWIHEATPVVDSMETIDLRPDRSQRTTYSNYGHAIAPMQTPTTLSSTTSSTCSTVSFHSATLGSVMEKDPSANEEAQSVLSDTQDIIEVIFDTSGSELSEESMSNLETMSLEGHAHFPKLSIIPEEATIRPSEDAHVAGVNSALISKPNPHPGAVLTKTSISPNTQSHLQTNQLLNTPLGRVHCISADGENDMSHDSRHDQPLWAEVGSMADTDAISDSVEVISEALQNTASALHTTLRTGPGGNVVDEPPPPYDGWDHGFPSNDGDQCPVWEPYGTSRGVAENTTAFGQVSDKDVRALAMEDATQAAAIVHAVSKVHSEQIGGSHHQNQDQGHVAEFDLPVLDNPTKPTKPKKPPYLSKTTVGRTPLENVSKSTDTVPRPAEVPNELKNQKVERNSSKAKEDIKPTSSVLHGEAPSKLSKKNVTLLNQKSNPRPLANSRASNAGLINPSSTSTKSGQTWRTKQVSQHLSCLQEPGRGCWAEV